MADKFEEYRTADGDMVDAIAFRRFGTSKDVTEQILDDNPGLAAMGEILPANIVVKIPVPVVPDRAVVPRLWD